MSSVVIMMQWSQGDWMGDLMVFVGGGVVLIALIFVIYSWITMSRLRARLAHEQCRSAGLVEMVETDDLTSAYSRRYMRNIFSQEAQFGQNATAFIDLDNFKSVNDGYGHKSGDALLKVISDKLVGLASPNEVVFRIGGDEFGVYMRDVDLNAATVRAERFQSAISEATIFVDGFTVSRSASVGVARIEKGQDLVGALYYADEAQYAVKSKGGNAVLANTGATLRSMIQRRTGPRAEDLAAAIKRNEVTYHVQPVFNTNTGAAIGVEALIRWQRSDGRVILPDQFIDVMTGNYNARVTPPLAAANKIADAFTRGPENIYCAFNISSGFLDRTVEDDDAWVQDLLAPLNPHRTVFEIVEHAVIRNMEKTRMLLNRLQAEGVRIALDDFGTGFSNLERLQQLNVDIVKIDRLFVRSIDQPGADIGILSALLDMSQAMGFEIIAEGVETEAECKKLRDLGIYNMQGFLLGRPDTAENWVGKLGLERSTIGTVLPAQ